MRVSKIVCDICGKEMREFYDCYTQVEMAEHDGPTMKMGEKYDVCRKCMSEVMKTVMMRRGESVGGICDFE